MPTGHHMGPEDYMLRHIDRGQAGLGNEAEQRRMAEVALGELISASITGVEVEKGDKMEDAGTFFTAKHSQMKGKQTDLIMFREGRPFLSIQVTTGMSERNREEKGQDLLADPYPTIRGSMVPRVLVALDWTEIQKLLKDHDPSRHPALLNQFFNGAKNSLLLIQMDRITKGDSLKKQFAKAALDFFTEQEKKIATTKKPTIH